MVSVAVSTCKYKQNHAVGSAKRTFDSRLWGLALLFFGIYAAFFPRNTLLFSINIAHLKALFQYKSNNYAQVIANGITGNPHHQTG